MAETIYPEWFYAQAKTDPQFEFVIPPENLNPWHCQNCAGVGNLFYYDDKGLKSAPCPVCAGDKMEQYLKNISGLQGDDLDIRIEHFKPLEGKKDAREIAGMILAMTPNPAGFFTFWGDYGTGKSTLLKAMTNGFRVANVPAIYIRMADILEEIKATYELENRESGEKILQSYKTCRALFIDEVDRIYPTEWALEKMFVLLDARYSQQSYTLTVMATNANPLELPEKLHYLSSRMTEGTIQHVGGVDVRPAIGLKRQKEFRQEAFDRGKNE
jgi:DNA replication protein DnaC